MDASCDLIGIGLENEAANFLGIITFHVVPKDGIEDSDILEVEAVGAALPPIPISALDSRHQTKFSFHTCFFASGRQAIRFVLKNSDGAVRQVIEREVVFTKPNDLSGRILHFFEAQYVPWGYFGSGDFGKYFPSQVEPDSDLKPWYDRSDASLKIEEMFAGGVIDAAERDHLNGFVKDGFMVFEGLIDDTLIDSVNKDIDAAISEKYNGYEYGSSARIEHLHAKSPSVRKLWLDPRHRRIGEILFGFKPRPAQTLIYVFGSQQGAHQDTIHLTSFPPGHMYGTWIALQTVKPESGELIYYPGSHREPRVYMHTANAERQDSWADFTAKVLPIWEEISSRYEPVVFRPRKGTVAIWHENLLHGGSVRKDLSLERRSIVIHSYADGCISLADSAGFTTTAVPLADLDMT